MSPISVHQRKLAVPPAKPKLFHQSRLANICLVILNSNEFVYVY
jgi:hypothetical protein